MNKFPTKPPIPPCAGWLAHNTQCCDCYAAERQAYWDDLKVGSMERLDRSLKKLFGRG